MNSNQAGGAIPGKLPTQAELLNPVLRAIGELGGSGNVQEIHDKVVELEQIPGDLATHMRPGRGLTELKYRLFWARTMLRDLGLVENSPTKRGVWALTAKARQLAKVDPQNMIRAAKEASEQVECSDDNEEAASKETVRDAQWKQELHQILTKHLKSDAFERLVQRLLRESGFSKVTVTGRSNDRGIDGHGILRLNGLISFRVVFQCKRYQGSVGSEELRNFRGAMLGRADRGLFVTTGTFTPAANAEATRDGAPPIDLIDGDELAEKLRDLKLGVRVSTKVIEEVQVDEAWFDTV